MQIIKEKIRDKKTGAIIEVKKSLVADYIGTGRYEIPKATYSKYSYKEEKDVKDKN